MSPVAIKNMRQAAVAMTSETICQSHNSSSSFDDEVAGRVVPRVLVCSLRCSCGFIGNCYNLDFEWKKNVIQELSKFLSIPREYKIFRNLSQFHVNTRFFENSLNFM
jgi:hypothetical protein